MSYSRVSVIICVPAGLFLIILSLICEIRLMVHMLVSIIKRHSHSNEVIARHLCTESGRSGVNIRPSCLTLLTLRV